MPTITLPQGFWYAWGSLCSLYTLGRTTEKFGINFGINNELPPRKQRGIFKNSERPKGRGIKPELLNKITNMITG
jgi:hypothetical protein